MDMQLGSVFNIDYLYYNIVRPITVKPLWVWESSVLVYKILVWQGEVEDYIGS